MSQRSLRRRWSGLRLFIRGEARRPIPPRCIQRRVSSAEIRLRWRQRCGISGVPARGLEPRTIGLKDRCSTRLSYAGAVTNLGVRCCSLRDSMSTGRPGWTSDGNWFWDGTQWNEAISEDGNWRFDGASWQPFTGQRTPMPAPVAAPPPAAPPSTPIAAPGVATPSWVDPSEVERLAREKREREAIAAQPVAPLSPEARLAAGGR